jgi:hypothetical protein
MTENSIKQSGSGGNLPVRRATNDEEINAVREMLLKKHNKKSPKQDEDAGKKSVRVRSLDERIGMKKEKPGALTTMISVQVPDEDLLRKEKHNPMKKIWNVSSKVLLKLENILVVLGNLLQHMNISLTARWRQTSLQLHLIPLLMRRE